MLITCIWQAITRTNTGLPANLVMESQIPRSVQTSENQVLTRCKVCLRQRHNNGLSREESRMKASVGDAASTNEQGHHGGGLERANSCSAPRRNRTYNLVIKSK